MTLRQLFSEIADAIRRKTGKEESIKAENFSEEIGKIPTADDVEEKTVKSTNVEQIVTPTEGKLINKINVEPIELENKSIIITENGTQTISADEGYDGLDEVSIVTNVPQLDTSDATAEAGDILQGETAYVDGNKITGTLGTENKTVKSSNIEQTITPTEGKLINEITVEAMKLEEVNVTPTTSTQTITPAQGKDGISQVNVGAVTSAIDSNIVAGNIKKNVEILGVVGNLEEGIDTSDATATAQDIMQDKTAYVNGQKITGTATSGGADLDDYFNTDAPSWSWAPRNAYKSIKKFPPINLGNLTTMYYMFDNCASLVEAPSFNTENVTNMSYAFNGCISLESVPQYDTGNVTDMSFMFNNCKKLTAIPQYDTSNVTNMKGMFELSGLATIPLLNTSNVTNMSNLFNGCSRLTTIPLIDTSNVTDMGSLFNGCSNLIQIPQLDTRNVSNMSSMFYNCQKLNNIPQLDTSSLTSCGSMFYNCDAMTQIPQLDTSRCTSTYNMFTSCGGLTTIPQLDTSNVTSMQNMFQTCTNLVTIPQLDTGKVANMQNMFQNCRNLVTIPVLNTGKIKTTNMQNMFQNCTNLSNESLNNILQMCINATLITSASYKKLSYIGLSSTQAATCQTLSNWDAFVAAGWTTGY